MSRHVAEERDAKGARGLGRHGTEGGHLEHASHRADLGLTDLRHTVEDELDGLLIEWSDGDGPAGDPAVLVSRRQLLREALLDADDELVQRCGQHESKWVSVNVRGLQSGVNTQRWPDNGGDSGPEHIHAARS